MKMPFQPGKLTRVRTHGFRKRMSDRWGRDVLKRRRRRGRKELAPAYKTK